MQKKLLFVINLPPPYHGVTSFNNNLLNSRVKLINEVILLDVSDHRSLDNLGKLDAVNVYLGLKNALQLIIKLLKEKPDIVYLAISQNKAFLRDGLFIAIAKIFSNAKIIAHNHGIFKDYYDNTNIFMRIFIDLTLRLANTVVVLGNNLRNTVSKWTDSIEVVPNGLDIEFEHKVNSEPKGRVVISYLGTFLESKGILDFLKAAEIILRKHRDVQFKLAGRWWQQEHKTKDRAEKFIESKLIKDNIELVGFVSGFEKIKFLKETDIFVYPTHYDAFPMALIEAMAAGCAIIATRVGAIPEMIIDNVSGVLIDKQCPEKIAQGIINLIENSKLRETLGTAARIKYEQYYTLEANIERMISLFNKVANN